MKNVLTFFASVALMCMLTFNTNAQDKTIVELAVATESLSTLVTAVTAAG
ncbi:MAG: hypothetical protein ACJAZM_003345, partial [Cyclobacteriaceae bacterium]